MATMNNSSVALQERVQEINDDVAELLIPSVVFVCICMLTGLVGNTMVLYYYGFKAKLNPTSVFILALAVYDTMVCLFSGPWEISYGFNYYTLDNIAACKITSFITYFASFGSNLTLIATAVDRYRLMCTANSHHRNVKRAVKHCVIVATVAVLLTWPEIIFYKIGTEPLPDRYGQDLRGTVCVRLIDPNSYILAMNGIHMIALFVGAVIMVVRYTRIGRTIYKHRKRMGKSENSQGPNTSSTAIDSVTIKVTIGMIVITAVFFISFIPSMAMIAWRSFKGKRQDHFLSGGQLLGFNFGRQTYFLNSCLNSLIYGIFNSRYRKFYYKKLSNRPEE